MKKKFNLFITILVILSLFVACKSGQDFDTKKALTDNSYGGAVAQKKPFVNETSTVENTTERKIIKNGNLQFQTDDIDKTTVFIETLVVKMSGYITNNSSNHSKTKESKHLTVRIPANKFDVFVEEISNGVKRFDHKEFYTDDVTTQFIDYEAHLHVKKETENRYLALLQKANTVSEIIEVEKALKDLRSEIESIEGQLFYLTSQVDYSTIYISYYTETTTASNFLNDVSEAFSNGVSLIRWCFLAIINIWPLLLIIGFIIFLILGLKKIKK